MQKVIFGNWKMHGSRAFVEEYLRELTAEFCYSETAVLGLFPPYVYLAQFQQCLQESAVVWGAQNCATELEGAYTGEISPKMLLEFGCRYVLLGHSERRSYQQEADKLIAQKFVLAKKLGLKPVLCLGETLKEREEGLTQAIVQRQLQAVLDYGVEQFDQAVLAYEPVWAIGTGLTPSAEEVQIVHAHLRARIAKQDIEIAQRLPILYGGSMKSSNAREFLLMPDVDGGLIGGASLQVDTLLEIYGIAALCSS